MKLTSIGVTAMLAGFLAAPGVAIPGPASRPISDQTVLKDLAGSFEPIAVTTDAPDGRARTTRSKERDCLASIQFFGSPKDNSKVVLVMLVQDPLTMICAAGLYNTFFANVAGDDLGTIQWSRNTFSDSKSRRALRRVSLGKTYQVQQSGNDELLVITVKVMTAGG